MHEIWEFGNKNIQKEMNGNSYANILYYYRYNLRHARMGQSPAQVFLISNFTTRNNLRIKYQEPQKYQENKYIYLFGELSSCEPSMHVS